MKTNFLKAAFAGVIFSASCLVSVANAGLIQADYLTLGDNLAAFDQETGLTWLDLSVTDGLAYDSVGSLYAGYRYATKDDILGLYKAINSDFLNITEDGKMLDQHGTTSFPFYLGYTQEPHNGNDGRVVWKSFGLYQDTDGLLKMAGSEDIAGHWTVYSPNQSNSQSKESLRSTPNDIYGIYMVKDAKKVTNDVPEPSTLAIFALGLMGLASRRFKK